MSTRKIPPGVRPRGDEKAGQALSVSTVDPSPDRVAEGAPFQLLPPLAEHEYAALKADIAERGIVVPVVVDQHGRTLDGHHRRRVAAELGIDCPTTTGIVTCDDDAGDLAVTLNAARRHLSREQRRDLIGAEIGRRPEDSDRAIARRVGCDHKTVGSVRRERRGELPHADPETLRSLQTQLAGLEATYTAIESTTYDDPDEEIRALLGIMKSGTRLVNDAVEYQVRCERRQGQMLNDLPGTARPMRSADAEALNGEIPAKLTVMRDCLVWLSIDAMRNKIPATEIADAVKVQRNSFGRDLAEDIAAPVREAMFGPVLDWLADPATAEEWRPQWDHPTFKPLSADEKAGALAVLAGAS